MGISEALYIPAGLSLIADWHQGKSRSLAVGVHMTGLYAGQAIGGFGATAAAAFSWQATFHWFGVVGVFYSLVLIFFLHENRIHNTAQKQSDIPGKKKASLFGGCLFSSLIGHSGSFCFILQLRVCRDGLLKTGFLLYSPAVWESRCLRPDLSLRLPSHFLVLSV